MQGNYNRSNKSGGSWLGFILLIVLLAIGSGVGLDRLFQDTEDTQVVDTTQKDYTQLELDESVIEEPIIEEPNQGLPISDEEPVDTSITEPLGEPILPESSQDASSSTTTGANLHDLSDYLEYKGSDVLELNGSGLSVGTTVTADFWPLDGYGRPTGARATLSQGSMRSSEGRPGITIDPVGFKNKQYLNANSKKYWLYNRSHLIAYTLFNGDTEVSENLVTGTQQMNQRYMTQYEDEIRVALRQNNVVEYQVEPMYREAELVPRALALRMRSSGGSIDKTVIIYNVQDGVTINYLTGESSGSGSVATDTQTSTPAPTPTNTPVTSVNNSNVTYKNCDAVRAAGAAPIHRGEPGYDKKLDRDEDGVGCE